MTLDSAVTLQRGAGNSAVVRLLERGGAAPTRGDPYPSERQRNLQRDALPAADDPQGCTQPGGVKNVAKSGLTRIEVTGLKYGVKGGHQAGYVNWRVKTVPSVEKQMTKESRTTRLLSSCWASWTRNGRRRSSCFHGWGFRDFDPYAGYAVATGEPSGAQGAHGTVRDVDQEHWEQQIGAVSKERAKNPKDPQSVAGPQIVAVLAEGRGMSDFGDVPTFDYIKDVFTKAGGNLESSVMTSRARSRSCRRRRRARRAGGDLGGA
jgi:hypothetical protein